MRRYPRFRPRGAMRGLHASRSGLLPLRSRRSRDASEVGSVSWLRDHPCTQAEMAPSYGTARILDPVGSDQNRTSAPLSDFKPAVKAIGSLAPTRRPSIWRTFRTYLWPKFRGDSLALYRGERPGITENMSPMLTQS